jgi:hypothetical protein
MYVSLRKKYYPVERYGTVKFRIRDFQEEHIVPRFLNESSREPGALIHQGVMLPPIPPQVFSTPDVMIPENQTGEKYVRI